MLISLIENDAMGTRDYGRVLAYHAQDPGFNLQHGKEEVFICNINNIPVSCAVEVHTFNSSIRR